MKWITIAEGTSPDNLHQIVAIESLPHNTPFKVIIEPKGGSLGWLFAKTFDMLGSEWVATKLYNEAGAILEDVEESGGNIVMHMRANFVVTSTLIITIAAVLLAAAILIAAIKIDAPEDVIKAISSTVMWAVIGIVVLTIAYVIYQRGGV